MLELQIMFQRRRKMLTRLIALLAIGVAGMLAVLPRTDAQASAVTPREASLMLFPAPVSSEPFSAFYGLAQR